MIELTPARLQRWSLVSGARSLLLAEQDYRLVEILGSISRDEVLRDRLAFKGGTALNKLYYGQTGRLSVDLDFNLLGTRDTVQASRGEVRGRIVRILRDHDPTMTVTHDHTWESLHVTAKYQPISAEAPAKIKVEISMVERIAICGIVGRAIELPAGGMATIPTYSVDELISTKLRAFYCRKKGRDLYDLDMAYPLLGDHSRLRRMVVFHFYRAGIIFDPDLVQANYRAKLADRVFLGDSTIYLKSGAMWDPELAAERFIQNYGFLSELGPREREFLDFASAVLGGADRHRNAGPIVDRPLERLFDGLEGVSAAARELSFDEIRVRKRR